jgi:hypothetical protein
LMLVREWYLSYIDLLRDMCLFSQATFLIRSCKDPFIGALNQQSTTIHESCPLCCKPLLTTPMEPNENNQGGPARRVCKSCRGQIGLCFLCHEPVRGVYVWCPGCGKTLLCLIGYLTLKTNRLHQDTAVTWTTHCNGSVVSTGALYEKSVQQGAGTSAT